MIKLSLKVPSLARPCSLRLGFGLEAGFLASLANPLLMVSATPVIELASPPSRMPTPW
jgi:hypothetical protein